jgi:hypothetical protein
MGRKIFTDVLRKPGSGEVLGKGRYDKIAFPIFLTLDPARDKPEKHLTAYRIYSVGYNNAEHVHLFDLQLSHYSILKNNLRYYWLRYMHPNPFKRLWAELKEIKKRLI